METLIFQNLNLKIFKKVNVYIVSNRSVYGFKVVLDGIIHVAFLKI